LASSHAHIHMGVLGFDEMRWEGEKAVDNVTTNSTSAT